MIFVCLVEMKGVKGGQFKSCYFGCKGELIFFGSDGKRLIRINDLSIHAIQQRVFSAELELHRPYSACRSSRLRHRCRMKPM